jgi:hypothetical protein
VEDEVRLAVTPTDRAGGFRKRAVAQPAIFPKTGPQVGKHPIALNTSFQIV